MQALRGPRRCTWSINNQNRIGLVNGIDVSIHHVAAGALIWRLAFILRERAKLMVNQSFAEASDIAWQFVPA